MIAHRPSRFGVEGVAGSGSHRRDFQRGAELAFRGPFDEVVDVVARPRSGGEPQIEVALGAAGQGEVVCRQPVEEPHRAEDLVAGVADRSALGGVVIGAASDAAQHPPRGEGGDGLAVLGAVDGGDGPGVEPFEAEEPFVAGSEDAVGDEHVAHVVRRHRAGVSV